MVKEFLNKVYNEDFIEGLKKLPNECVDMILTDLPYEVTDFEWDRIIPFESMWAEYKRVLKKNGVVVLTATQPFTTKLIYSNLDMFKYNWVWEKDNSTNFFNAKYQPLKIHEDICVFYNAPNEIFKKNTYFFSSIIEYLRNEKKKTGLTESQLDELLGCQMSGHYFGYSQWHLPSKANYKKLQETGFFTRDYQDLKDEQTRLREENRAELRYYPVMTKGTHYKTRKGKTRTGGWFANKDLDANNTITITDERYPKSIIKFNKQTGLHPSQKPTQLFEYLIETYTKPGEVVLDTCMGSGTTAIACLNTNRYYIGFELMEDYYKGILERIEKHKKEEQNKLIKGE